MNRIAVVIILALFASSVLAQANDLAAERARLANQRIEAEARAREEQERQARLAAERKLDEDQRQAAQSAAVETRNNAAEADAPPAQAVPVRATPPEAARTPGDVDRMLEQIRTLGELRDAGYVTEAEFERIKRRILDGAL